MKIHLLKHQSDFLKNQTKFVAMVGGIGSGKSRAGAYYSINRMLKYPKAMHFIGANTHKQLRDSTLAAVFKTLNDLQLSFSYNQNQGLLTVENGKSLCGSMENFDVHRGIEVGSFWLDECRDLKREAFDMMMGRLRDIKAPTLEGRLTTSSNGFDWIYDYFHKEGEFNNHEFSLVKATSYENKYLPDGYIDSLKNQYSDKLFKQEILGEFLDLMAGRAYYAFSELNINPVSPWAQPDCKFMDPRKSIILGADFNVNPMAWYLGQRANRKWHWFNEIYIPESNTPEASQELVNRLIEFRNRGLIKCEPNIIICGDAAGNSKNTKSAGKSDYDILKANLDRNGFTYEDQTPDANPPVKDRVNAVNAVCKSANGQIEMTIDPSCKQLIKDMRKVSWKEGTGGLDKLKDLTLTHSSDAIGYPIIQLTPVPGTDGGVGKLVVINY